MKKLSMLCLVAVLGCGGDDEGTGGSSDGEGTDTGGTGGTETGGSDGGGTDGGGTDGGGTSSGGGTGGTGTGGTSGGTGGADVTLQPVADSWIQDEDGNSRDDNMGSSDLMTAGGRWQTTSFRSLIRFDVSSIPGDATITNATLRLYHTNNAVEGSNTNTINVYRLLRDWQEGEVTWNDHAAGSAWTSPGADSVGDDRDDTVIVAVPFTSASPLDQYYDFDVTSAVQAHVDGGAPNHGFLLIGKETPAADRYFTGFNTKEAAANNPLLEVSY